LFLFLQPLRVLFPYSSATYIAFYATAAVLFCGGFIASETLRDRFRKIARLRIAALAILIGYGVLSILFSFNEPSRSRIGLFVCFVLAGAGAGATVNACGAAGFSGQSHRTVTFASSGAFAVGGLLLGWFANKAVESVGLRWSYITCGMLDAAVILICSVKIEQAEDADGDNKNDFGLRFICALAALVLDFVLPFCYH
jgi:hypothetical protein